MDFLIMKVIQTIFGRLKLKMMVNYLRHVQVDSVYITLISYVDFIQT